MKLKDFIKIPNFFLKKTFPNIHHIKLVSIKLKENNFLLEFSVPSSNIDIKYRSFILINTDNQISGNNDCKFKCSCNSFKYEYETMLYKNSALIGNPENIKLPKKQKLFICKHLYMCIQIILKFRNITNLSYVFKTKIEGEKKDDSN